VIVYWKIKAFTRGYPLTNKFKNKLAVKLVLPIKRKINQPSNEFFLIKEKTVGN